MLPRLLHTVLTIALTAGNLPASPPKRTLFDAAEMREMRDASTLDVKVLQGWHAIEGPVPTRQKLVTISVGEVWPGQDYRIPVRFIVPAERKAKGFHLTGGHNLPGIRRDARLSPIDQSLLQGGVGLVHTIVQTLDQSDQAALGREMDERFLKTLDPHYSIQYWGWPATLMRAVTAAHAETGHFAPGKIAMSGGSKNGASPSAALINDVRMTAVHASVSPIWDSPLRLCDRPAWDELRKFNEHYAAEQKKKDPDLRSALLLRHPFLGGTFGPVYNNRAIAAGHDWNELRQLAERMAPHVFVSRNLEQFKKRGIDMLFHPGTHDFVAFDVAWGGAHFPQIPVYLNPNTGHGKKGRHPAAPRDEQNKSAWLVHHFFDGVAPMLPSPAIACNLNGPKLAVTVTVTFPPGSKPESGRLCWMINRGPDGSHAYLREPFPDDQWTEMKPSTDKHIWTAEIDLPADTSHIDLFSTHRKTTTHRSQSYPSYISSPYTRIPIP